MKTKLLTILGVAVVLALLVEPVVTPTAQISIIENGNTTETFDVKIPQTAGETFSGEASVAHRFVKSCTSEAGSNKKPLCKESTLKSGYSAKVSRFGEIALQVTVSAVKLEEMSQHVTGDGLVLDLPKTSKWLFNAAAPLWNTEPVVLRTDREKLTSGGVEVKEYVREVRMDYIEKFGLKLRSWT